MLQDEAAEQRDVLDADAVRRPGARAQVVELRAQRRQRPPGEKAHDRVGELVDHRDEEVPAAARGIEHAELEQPPRRRLRVRVRELLHLREVSRERRHDAAAHEVTDERLRRVVDAAALAAALVGEPEQLAFVRVGVALAVRGVAVASFVVPVGAVGDRQAKREEALVDVAEVPDL